MGKYRTLLGLVDACWFGTMKTEKLSPLSLTSLCDDVDVNKPLWSI
jgi:hypothetical protein